MPTATEVQEPQGEERVRVWEAARVPRAQKVPQIPQLLQQRPLFADSLLDLGKQERNRRKFATVLSFIFQCLLIGTFLILPLMFTEALPHQQLLTFLVAPPPPPPPPPPAAEAGANVVRQIQSDLLTSGQLRTPSRIPAKVQMIREEEAPPPLLSTVGVVGGVPVGHPGWTTRRGDWRHCQPNIESQGGSEVCCTSTTSPRFAGSNQGIADSEDRTEVSALGAGSPYMGPSPVEGNHRQGR